MKKNLSPTHAIVCVSLIMVLVAAGSAQTTSFTFQGSLSNAGVPADGNYDLQFSLFNTLTNGIQFGTTQTRVNVPVSNGTFSVTLDFGNQFPGPLRFLEISVRPSGAGAFTLLTPRQLITSAPHSIKALDAENAATAANSIQLGGLAANQYVITTDPRMSDARQPVAGNSNYVQNRTTLQTATNFNISGVGNANVLNAVTQFNLNGSRILGTSGLSNTYGGLNAGANASNLAESNTFFGNGAGQQMVTAGSNSFFGAESGQNTTVGANSFFGSQSGKANTSGQSNSFFGVNAGTANTTAGDNSFFGRSTGTANTTGEDNAFFGRSAGQANTTGGGNSFFGRSAGLANTTGSNNTMIGNGTNVGAANLTFATAIGAGAVVDASNRIQLGRSTDTVRVPGTLQVDDITGDYFEVGFRSTFHNVTVNNLMDTYLSTGGSGNLVCFQDVSGSIKRLSLCGSSERFKKNIRSWRRGLDLVMKLNPVSFDWKNNDSLDVGLIAEEVAAVEPLLATTNHDGETQGVKYDRISVLLVNAVKEQQAQINDLKKQNEEFRKLMVAQDKRLKALAARMNRRKTRN